MTTRPRHWILTVSLAVLLLAGIGAYLLLRPGTFDLHGTLVLDSEWQVGSNHTCSGKATYEDVREGAQVVITDPAGTTVALGHLGLGKPKEPVGCGFPISVPDVPAGHRIYGVAIPGHGDPVQVSERDAANGGVQLILAKVT